MNHLAKNEETGQTRGQKKEVRRKKEAGKAGIKKSKVPPHTTPPPDRPRPAEKMLLIRLGQESGGIREGAAAPHARAPGVILETVRGHQAVVAPE